MKKQNTKKYREAAKLLNTKSMFKFVVFNFLIKMVMMKNTAQQDETENKETNETCETVKDCKNPCSGPGCDAIAVCWKGRNSQA